jgi:hypothetical protein
LHKPSRDNPRAAHENAHIASAHGADTYLLFIDFPVLAFIIFGYVLTKHHKTPISSQLTAWNETDRIVVIPAQPLPSTLKPKSAPAIDIIKSDN